MEIVWGIVLRVVQGFLQGAPFILSGLCIAAILERLMGHGGTRTLFGSGTAVSLAQSWLIGMLLPGCSLGVIPICRRLRAAGIAGGTIFAFALSSPLFDPLSLLYGLTLSKPLTIIAFAGFSLAVVSAAGFAFDRMFPDAVAEEAERPVPPPGIRRMTAILLAMARESVGPAAGLVAIGLLGSALLAAVLPFGALQTALGHENPAAPLVMTAVAVPAYATPMTVMSQLGSMFQHGNSVGAAFVLLTLGAGVNLGLIVWIAREYGGKRLAAWMGLMLVIVIVLAYGIERPLHPADAEPAGHTHAFDRYCAPYARGQAPAGGYAADVLRRVRVETLAHEWAGVAALGLVMAAGVALRALDPRKRLEAWLERRPSVAVRGARWDFDLPAPVLAAAGLLAIVALSVTACYAYYPPPSQAIEELSTAGLEAVAAAHSGDRRRALEWIPICEGWTRRLLVGMYLRQGSVADDHLAKSRILEARLEDLEHALEEGDAADEVRRAALDADKAKRSLAAALRGTPPVE